MSEQSALPPAASEYRGRRRADPTPIAEPGAVSGSWPAPEPTPLTRRELLEQRRRAEQVQLDEQERQRAQQAAQAEAETEPETASEPTPEPAPEPPPAPRETGRERHESDRRTGERAPDRTVEPIPQPRAAAQSLPTRREVQQQRRTAEARRKQSHGHGPRKSAVVLGAATVALVAVSAGHAFGSPPAQTSAAAELPTGVAATQQLDPKVSSSAVMAALRTGDSFALPKGVRASRSVNRPVLPGCSGEVTDYSYANGHVPSNELCALTFAPGHHLRADAAVALARLNIAYRARFGHNVCLTDSYRTIASQESLAARKPGLAAVPGTSEHGMGLAVDFCGGIEKYRSVEYNWMRANAPAFGWDNPDWAIPPSSREEPWHWEYVVGEAKTPGSQRLQG